MTVDISAQLLNSMDCGVGFGFSLSNPSVEFVSMCQATKRTAPPTNLSHVLAPDLAAPAKSGLHWANLEFSVRFLSSLSQQTLTFRNLSAATDDDVL